MNASDKAILFGGQGMQKNGLTGLMKSTISPKA